MEGVGATPAVGQVAGLATKFTSVIINVLAPIGTFILGYSAKDPAGLEAIIRPYLPKVLQGTVPVAGTVSGYVTALAYAGLAGMIFYASSMAGGLVGGVIRAAAFFFVGCAVRLVFAGLAGSAVKSVVPSNA